MKIRIVLLVIILQLILPLIAGAADKRRVTVVPKASGEKKIALVIGNGSYKTGPLRNPVNDARLMASTLRELGFEVDERTNLTMNEMKEAIDRFGRKIQGGGVALFYYAGHGMQVKGNNYLVPVDADIKFEAEVDYKTVNAGLVLAQLEGVNNPMNIVILDACRDNPFARSWRSANRGLAVMNAPSGTYVAYATAPGSTASDGKGANGLYTSVLVRQMRVPGQKIEDVFKRVRTTVKNDSAGQQVPWESSSLEGDFYFAGGGGEQQTYSQPAKYQTERVSEPKVAKADKPAPRPVLKEEPEPRVQSLTPEPQQNLVKVAPRPQASESELQTKLAKVTPISKASERFVKQGAIVIDHKLGLEWVPAPDKPMNHYDAEKYAQSLSIGGGGWRLPTREELKSLYDTSKSGNADPLLNVGDKWVWSSEVVNSTSAMGFYFKGSVGGKARWPLRVFVNDNHRVLAVRSRK